MDNFCTYFLNSSVITEMSMYSVHTQVYGQPLLIALITHSGGIYSKPRLLMVVKGVHPNDGLRQVLLAVL